MAIQTFPPTAAGQTAALAVADPKNVWFDVTHFVVRNGPDYIPPRQEELDRQAAMAYPKLQALRNMTPAQVQAWVSANVTTLAQAQDAIATIAIAVSILSRQL